MCVCVCVCAVCLQCVCVGGLVGEPGYTISVRGTANSLQPNHIKMRNTQCQDQDLDREEETFNYINTASSFASARQCQPTPVIRRRQETLVVARGWFRRITSVYVHLVLPRKGNTFSCVDPNERPGIGRIWELMRKPCVSSKFLTVVTQ